MTSASHSNSPQNLLSLAYKAAFQHNFTQPAVKLVSSCAVFTSTLCSEERLNSVLSSCLYIPVFFRHSTSSTVLDQSTAAHSTDEWVFSHLLHWSMQPLVRERERAQSRERWEEQHGLTQRGGGGAQRKDEI